MVSGHQQNNTQAFDANDLRKLCENCREKWERKYANIRWPQMVPRNQSEYFGGTLNKCTASLYTFHGESFSVFQVQNASHFNYALYIVEC